MKRAGDLTFEFEVYGGQFAGWRAWWNNPRQPACRGSFDSYRDLWHYMADRLPIGSVKDDKGMDQ